MLLDNKPKQHIFNVGNSKAVSVRQWVEMCYKAAGKTAVFNNIYSETDQRKYFCFYDYEYYLDVSKQHMLMPKEKDINRGLEESFMWYKANSDKVNKKPYLDYIDAEFMNL